MQLPQLPLFSGVMCAASFEKDSYITRSDAIKLGWYVYYTETTKGTQVRGHYISL